jgi:hypothetical protein
MVAVKPWHLFVCLLVVVGLVAITIIVSRSGRD